jgi:hypothetical protein
MSESKFSLLKNLLTPSILDSIFVVLLIFIIFYDQGAQILKDGDTGFHIMTGRYILDNLQFPSHDVFSYTSYGKEWVAFSWATGVLFALMDNLAGLNGVVLLNLLVLLATFYIIYRLLMRCNINFYLMVFSMVCLISLTSIHWLARPHLFTILFMALLFYMLEIARENKKIYYFIPLIILLWVNFHPGFISGFFLLGAYIAGNIIEYLIAKAEDRKRHLHTARIISMTMLASVFVTILNPYGFKLYAYIYNTLTSYWIVNATREYLSPNFHNNFSVIVYGLVAGILIMAGLLSQRRVLDIPKILILLLWMHLSLFASRNIALFGIVAIPCMALMVQNVIDSLDLQSLKDKSEKLLVSERSLKCHFWPALIFIITVIIILNNGYFLDKKILACDFSPEKMPVNAMKFIEKNPVKGNILNHDNWGGYLIYRYPDIKVFMDGRLDMYQQKFLDDYQRVITLKPGWQEVLIQHNIDWALIKRNTLLRNFLLHHPDWFKVYEDNVTTIFILNK